MLIILMVFWAKMTMAAQVDWNLYSSTVALRIIRNNLSEDVCSGVLVAPHLVLTVAHCFAKPKNYDSKMVVAVADVTLDPEGASVFWTQKLSQQERRVQQIILHPDYSELKQKQDFALLVLESPFPKNLNFPKLFSFGEFEAQELIRIGYGKRESGENRRTHLNTYFSKIAKEGAVRGLAEFNDIFSYPGDSGGPLFQKRPFGVVGVHTGRALDVDGQLCAQSFMAPIDGGVLKWIEQANLSEK